MYFGLSLTSYSDLEDMMLSRSMTYFTAENHKKTRRPLVLISLIMAMFMAGIECTSVAIAMACMVGELGGFSLYSWVFSSFLLVNAVTTMIFGELSDLFGRTAIFMIGVFIFLIGSIMSG